MNSGTELDQIFHTHFKHRAGVVDRGGQSSLQNIYFHLSGSSPPFTLHQSVTQSLERGTLLRSKHYPICDAPSMRSARRRAALLHHRNRAEITVLVCEQRPV